MTYHRFIACAVTTFLAAALLTPTLQADDSWANFEGSVTFGEQYFLDTDNHNSAKFEQYRDVPNGPVAEALTLNWKPVDRVFFTLNATDIGQRDQAMSFAFGKEHLWRTTILWQENPRLYGEEAFSPYSYRGDGVFTLPDEVQDDIENGWSDVMTLMTGAMPVDLGYQRKTGSVRLEFFPTENLSFSLFAERERRNGTHNQPMGMYRSYNKTELPIPIDYQTDNVALNIAYDASRFSFGAEIYISDFETRNDYIVWDHALFLNDNYTGNDIEPGRQAMAMFPDNQLRRWTVHGSFNLPRHTRITALISHGTTTQDDRLHPYTVSTEPTFMIDLATMLGGFSLPSNIDGRHDTNVYDFKVVSRPVDWLTLKAFWKEYDYRNKTKSITMPGYVVGDHNFGDSRRNLPYDYDKTTYGAGAKARPLDWLSFGLDYSMENMKRNWANVTDSDEDTLKATLDLDVTDWLFLRAMGKWQERDTHSYDSHYNQPSFPLDPLYEYENFGMRRFYQTDRDRDSYSLMIQVTPVEQFEIYGELTFAENDYGMPKLHHWDPPYTLGETSEGPHHGLLKDENSSWTVGVSFMPDQRFSGWVDYTYEKTKHDVASRERRHDSPVQPRANDPDSEWWSHTSERYKTITAGFDTELVKDTVDLNVSLSHTRGRGYINTDWIPGGVSGATGDPSNDWGDWATTKDDLTMAQIFLDWHLRSNLDTGFRYTYEDWDGEDWQIDAMQPYMGYTGDSTGIYLGANWEDYTNHIVSLLVHYSF